MKKNFTLIELLVENDSLYISRSDYLKAIDWNFPGLEDGAARWNAGDEAGALRALADYYRKRGTSRWDFNLLAHANIGFASMDGKIPECGTEPAADGSGLIFPYDKQAADAVVNGTFNVVRIPYTFPDGKIDWHFNPTLNNPEKAPNYEWQWQLGRFYFWDNLACTYRMTGNAKYAETFVKHLRSWCDQCPAPQDSDGNSFGSSWRTIECGDRLAYPWPNAFFMFLNAPEFTDEDLILMLRSMLEQARHLKAHPTSGNWLFIEMDGMYTFASTFPEIRECADMRKFATDKISEALKKQILPDGVQNELAIGYHRLTMDLSIKMMKTAYRTGFQEEFPKDFLSIVEKGFGYLVNTMTPDWSCPHFNDSWPMNIPFALKDAASIFPDNQDFAWVYSKGVHGHKPEKTAFFMPWAGFGIMRSDWTEDATYISFDCGPLGRGHWHQDKLNVTINRGRRELLFDDGGGSYEQSSFRTYAISAKGHSTILVDGEPQNRSGAAENQIAAESLPESSHEFGEMRDYVEGVYDQGFGTYENMPARHTRQLLFIKPNILFVCDILESKDGESHDYQQRWQINDTKTIEILAGHPARMTDTAGEANLVIAPLLTENAHVSYVSAQEEPELLGWYSIKDSTVKHRPATTCLVERSGNGTQVFLTLFMTLPPDAESPVLGISQLDSRSAAVSLKDGRKLVVSAPDTPAERFSCKISE